MAENNEHNKDMNVREKQSERRYPSLEVAEARLKLALLRHKAMVERTRLSIGEEKTKVRL